MRTATWIKVDGTETEVQPRNGKRFELEELQKMVGGYIELVRTQPPVREMYINEEGLLDGLPVNPVATLLIASGYMTDGGVRGDVVVINRPKKAVKTDAP